MTGLEDDNTRAVGISLIEDRDTWEMCIEFDGVPDNKTLQKLVEADFIGSTDMKDWRRPLGHLSRVAALSIHDHYVLEHGLAPPPPAAPGRNG
jgi:hypothetical protein